MRVYVCAECFYKFKVSMEETPPRRCPLCGSTRIMSPKRFFDLITPV